MLRGSLVLVATLGVGVCTLGGQPPKPPPKEGVLRQLQGQWKMEWSEEGGRRTEADLPESQGLTIDRDKWLIGKREFGVITLDTTTDPMLLDLKMAVSTYEADKGEVLEGVFQVDGDNLTVCFARSRGEAKARPADFTTKDNPRAITYRYKRVKG